MRNHVIEIIAITLTILSLIVTFNWLVDPANLFSHEQYERGIAHQLNQGKFVAGVTNYDERLLQRFRLQEIQTSRLSENGLPKTIVIGSSRSMQIHSGTGMAILNLSVSGASIEDYVAILQLADFIPYSKIVIGVDPWVFNKNNSQTRWHSICQYWRMGMEQMLNQVAPEVDCFGGNKWQQLVNFSYTKASVNQLLTRIQQPGKSSGEWYLKSDDTPEQYTDLIRPDGSRVVNAAAARAPLSTVIAKAKLLARTPVYSMSDFHILDKDTKTIFEKLMLRMKQKGIEVVIFLPPFHPSAYSSIVAIIPQLKEVEYYLQDVSHSLGLMLIGSYDPSRAGCTKEEFFDGMHPNDSCIKKLFAPDFSSIP